MKNYTVRVKMVIEAEIEVEAEDRDAAEAAAGSDHDRVMAEATIERVEANVIQEGEVAV